MRDPRKRVYRNFQAEERGYLANTLRWPESGNQEHWQEIADLPANTLATWMKAWPATRAIGTA